MHRFTWISVFLWSICNFHYSMYRFFFSPKLTHRAILSPLESFMWLLKRCQHQRLKSLTQRTSRAQEKAKHNSLNALTTCPHPGVHQFSWYACSMPALYILEKGWQVRNLTIFFPQEYQLLQKSYYFFLQSTHHSSW